jgi:hypothetical protein
MKRSEDVGWYRHCREGEGSKVVLRRDGEPFIVTLQNEEIKEDGGHSDAVCYKNTIATHNGQSIATQNIATQNMAS